MSSIPLEKIGEKYLKRVPLAHALPRIIECSILKKFNFSPPVLDLGCGDGIFAQICLGEGQIDVGLDLNPQEVTLAQKSGAYKEVVVARADKMPLADGFFGTVISNSVLEHIPNLDLVFKEVHRVLRKGGRFIFVVPDKTASDYFFYAGVLQKLGLKNLAVKYTDFKNGLFHYAHLEGKDFWQKISIRNGFKIKSAIGFTAPKTVTLMDFLSPLALPSYLVKKFFGRHVVVCPDFLAKILTSRILPYCGPVPANQATGWCFEVEKA